MRKTGIVYGILLVPLLLGAGTFAAFQYAPADVSALPQEPSLFNAKESEQDMIEKAVEAFGARLRLVSLTAPLESLRVSIVEQYAQYVTPELLASWVVDPSYAPGRLVSSPWPDRIELSGITKEDAGYSVQGYIIELASDGETGRTPVSLSLIEHNKQWLIDSFLVKDVVLHDVPFTPQAPFANWLDPRQNYGCEETSAFMAISWARGETFSLKEAEDTITSIADWQEEHYGEFHDTSAADTIHRIFQGYFDFHNAELRSRITVDDIKEVLWEGGIAVVPVRGQALQNPYYTPPGPLIHMVVVIGYDSLQKEFIVNDPGTKRGGQLRYQEDVLGAALQDYRSGFNEPLLETPSQVMIIVTPEPAAQDSN